MLVLLLALALAKANTLNGRLSRAQQVLCAFVRFCALGPSSAASAINSFVYLAINYLAFAYLARLLVCPKPEARSPKRETRNAKPEARSSISSVLSPISADDSEPDRIETQSRKI